MLKNPISFKSDFDPNLISLKINEYLEKSEQQFSDIIQGVSKKIIWANKKNTKTPISIVYIHRKFT